jgi:hypothetical protein
MKELILFHFQLKLLPLLYKSLLNDRSNFIVCQVNLCHFFQIDESSVSEDLDFIFTESNLLIWPPNQFSHYYRNLIKLLWIVYKTFIKSHNDWNMTL